MAPAPATSTVQRSLAPPEFERVNTDTTQGLRPGSSMDGNEPSSETAVVGPHDATELKPSLDMTPAPATRNILPPTAEASQSTVPRQGLDNSKAAEASPSTVRRSVLDNASSPKASQPAVPLSEPLPQVDTRVEPTDLVKPNMDLKSFKVRILAIPETDKKSLMSMLLDPAT